jgi:hypothetical protein
MLMSPVWRYAGQNHFAEHLAPAKAALAIACETT